MKESTIVENPKKETQNKYTLRDPIDLRSKFLLDVDARKLQKANELKQQELQQQLEELKIVEQLPEDEYCGNRRHAWVVILSNVEWAAKKCAGPNHEFDKDSVIRPFFIEPSTGVHFAVDDPNYFRIDSVWNETNYYVCFQLMVWYIFNFLLQKKFEIQNKMKLMN